MTLSADEMASGGKVVDPDGREVVVPVPRGTVVVDGVALEVKRAAVAASTSGDNTLVAAVAGKAIRVVQIVLVAAGAVSARLESDAGGVALTGSMPLPETGGFVLPFSEAGWVQTGEGELLNLELSGAVAVAGALSYVEV